LGGISPAYKNGSKSADNDVWEFGPAVLPDTRMEKKREGYPGLDLRDVHPAATVAGQHLEPQNLALLVERLGGAIVATHSQSGIMGHHMIDWAGKHVPRAPRRR
jgi:hypothetical protein